MKNKWYVEQHGEKVFTPVICRDCGNLIENRISIKKDYGKRMINGAFQSTWYQEKVRCKECGCVMSREIENHLEINKNHLKEFICIIFMVIGILTFIIMGILAAALPEYTLRFAISSAVGLVVCIISYALCQ